MVKVVCINRHNNNGAMVNNWLTRCSCTAEMGNRTPLAPPLKPKTMGKTDKKKRKLQERIDFLQSELTESLTKKSGKTAEINVGEYQRKITELRQQLALL